MFRQPAGASRPPGAGRPFRSGLARRPAGGTVAALPRHTRWPPQPPPGLPSPPAPASGRAPPALRKASSGGATAGGRRRAGWQPPPARTLPFPPARAGSVPASSGSCPQAVPAPGAGTPDSRRPARPAGTRARTHLESAGRLSRQTGSRLARGLSDHSSPLGSYTALMELPCAAMPRSACRPDSSPAPGGGRTGEFSVTLCRAPIGSLPACRQSDHFGRRAESCFESVGRRTAWESDQPGNREGRSSRDAVSPEGPGTGRCALPRCGG